LGQVFHRIYLIIALDPYFVYETARVACVLYPW
jgi:hypothetical protein